MATGMSITGVKTVLKNLKKSKQVTEIGVESGLIEGAKFLEVESKKIVPVDTSNLMVGGRHRKNPAGGSGFDADILVEYLAEYSVYVHEDMTARHKTGKRAKFLEEPARTKRKEIIKIVNEEARRKYR